ARRPITEPPPPPVAARRTPPSAAPPPPAAATPTPTPAPPTAAAASAPAAPAPASAPAAAAATPASAPAASTPAPAPPKKPPPDGRSTAAWASEPLRPPDDAAQSGPFVGKLAAIPDEPAFAAPRFRSTDPEADYKTGKVSRLPDEDEVLPARSGTRAGLWIVLALLAFGGAAAAGVYMFVIKKDSPRQVVTPTPDAGSAVIDAAVAVPTPVDAPEPPPISPVDTARGELLADNEVRLKAAFESLAGKDEPAAQAVRANLAVGLAQALIDRASLTAERAEADKLRASADPLVMEAFTSAQRALKAVPDDAAANLAMAAVLRLQKKSATQLKRYSNAARQKGDPAWARDVALADALVLARDSKLEEARAALEAIDSGEGRLETSSDVRARFQLAKVLLLQGKAADAKPLVEQVLAAQPEHAAAKALAAKLETAVTKSDPLPPEDPDQKDPKDPKGGSGSAPRPPDGQGSGSGAGPVAGGSYDALVRRADTTAERDCAQAIPIYQKALEQKQTGVEAMTGLGYCFIDQKQFASAFGKFRSALAISPRFEPALWGIGEAYVQQGRKEQAIEAFQRYLEVFPGSAKAQKQLERLGAAGGGGGGGAGGGSGSAGGGGGTGSAAPAPTPPSTPAPGAGSGSG
ncbi:MAG TPA: tetratricopeptide repeat protein, partial [Kofleriaceae bacterium]|nr:tetratricopeptide repeat protein [Kofleriaceae bacterium]